MPGEPETKRSPQNPLHAPEKNERPKEKQMSKGLKKFPAFCFSRFY